MTLSQVAKLLKLQPCPDSSWKRIGTSCYVVSNQTATQPDAQLACDRLVPGAHLASVHADSLQEIQALLASSGTGRRFVWLGLEKVGDVWAWSDGSSLDVTDWGPYQPDNRENEDCVFWFSFSEQWLDIRCSFSDLSYYLCQLDLA